MVEAVQKGIFVFIALMVAISIKQWENGLNKPTPHTNGAAAVVTSSVVTPKAVK